MHSRYTESLGDNIHINFNEQAYKLDCKGDCYMLSLCLSDFLCSSNYSFSENYSNSDNVLKSPSYLTIDLHSLHHQHFQFSFISPFCIYILIKVHLSYCHLSEICSSDLDRKASLMLVFLVAHSFNSQITPPHFLLLSLHQHWRQYTAVNKMEPLAILPAPALPTWCFWKTF